jgi:hypothetical protein
VYNCSDTPLHLLSGLDIFNFSLKSEVRLQKNPRNNFAPFKK